MIGASSAASFCQRETARSQAWQVHREGPFRSVFEWHAACLSRDCSRWSSRPSDGRRQSAPSGLFRIAESRQRMSGAAAVVALRGSAGAPAAAPARLRHSVRSCVIAPRFASAGKKLGARLMALRYVASASSNRPAASFARAALNKIAGSRRTSDTASACRARAPFTSPVASNAWPKRSSAIAFAGAGPAPVVKYRRDSRALPCCKRTRPR